MEKEGTCLYRHIKPNGEIFYIGIGSFKRAYSKDYRNKHWIHVVNKYGYEVQVLKTGLTWNEAVELEILLISHYGRRDLGIGTLVNLTDGGEGAVGVVRTDEQKKMYGSWNIGRKPTEEHLQKNREANSGEKNAFYGKRHSPETLEQIRQKLTGKKASGETRALLRSQRTSDKHSASKLVLDTSTGIFFDSAKDAAKAYNISHSTLKSRLNGGTKNKTNLIYC